jgi:hypothetical protein
MMQLAIQISQDINKRLEMLNRTVTPVIAEEIAQMMKDNSGTGKAFGADRYDDEYTEPYKRKRARAGVATAPVTLRFKARSIESTRVETTGTGSTIKFDDPNMGVIFGYHHEGIDYARVGNRMRSVFPKTAESVPQSIKDMAARLIGEALANGR